MHNHINAFVPLSQGLLLTVFAYLWSSLPTEHHVEHLAPTGGCPPASWVERVVRLASPTIFCSPALCSTIPHIQVFEAMRNNTSHPGIEAMCTYRYPLFMGFPEICWRPRPSLGFEPKSDFRKERTLPVALTVQPPLKWK